MRTSYMNQKRILACALAAAITAPNVHADQPGIQPVVYRTFTCIMTPDLMHQGRSVTGCDPVEGENDLPITRSIDSCEKNLAAFAAHGGQQLINHRLWDEQQTAEHPLSAVWYECKAVPVK